MGGHLRYAYCGSIDDDDATTRGSAPAYRRLAAASVPIAFLIPPPHWLATPRDADMLPSRILVYI